MIIALLSILAGVIVASLVAWLYSQRWPAPQPRARIAKGSPPQPPGGSEVSMWKVTIYTHSHEPYQHRVTYWVRWSDAIRFANERVAWLRSRR